jgi:threonine synthase
VKSGDYKPLRPSAMCISNAMNVGHPSNLARLFNMYGGWLDVTGEVLEEPDLEAIRRDMFAVSITDDETRKTIEDVYKKYGIVLEPHGAVGFAGLERYLKESGDKTLAVSVETADPAKFPEEIVKATGVKPEIPDSMKALDDLEEDYEEMDNDYKQFKTFLKKFNQ